MTAARRSARVRIGHGSCYSEQTMKKSTTAPRTTRKTTSTAAKTVPAEKKLTAPRLRRVAKKAPAPADSGPGQGSSPSVDDVRFRAYQIYLGRNGKGDDVSDWLQAEQELITQAG
jgi:hypothetical protein